MVGEFACLTAAFGREEPPATHYPARAGEFSAAAGALVFSVSDVFTKPINKPSMLEVKSTAELETIM